MVMALILMEFQKLKQPVHVMYSIEQGPLCYAFGVISNYDDENVGKA